MLPINEEGVERELSSHLRTNWDIWASAESRSSDTRCKSKALAPPKNFLTAKSCLILMTMYPIL